VITNLNNALSSLFAYTKQELINKKINVLMPEMIASNHDKIIEDFLMQKGSKMLMKERILYGKTKCGYLLPIHLTLQVYPYCLPL
jgi:PAS domain S-box-containing protein